MKKQIVLFVFTVILAIFTVIFQACQRQPNDIVKSQSVIRYGGQYYPEEFLLAGDTSFWRKYGIEVKHTLFSSGAEANEALISGNVDINCAADSKIIELFNILPQDALIIGVTQRGNRYATIVRKDSSYSDWSDLIGKTVATRFGTGAEVVLRKYYVTDNYSWSQFKYVNMKIEDMIAALENGQIEAFTGWEPTPSIAEAMGIGRVLRTYGDVALAPVCLQTTKKFAVNHPDELTKFLAAHLDKAELIKNDPSGAANIAVKAATQKGINVSGKAFENVFRKINFDIDFNEQVGQDIYDTAKFMYEQGKLDRLPTLSWDMSLIKRAQLLKANFVP